MTRASLALLLALCAIALLPAQQRGAAPAPKRTPPSPPRFFEDVAANARVTFTHSNGATPDRNLAEIMSGGGLFLDVDADGWQDIVLIDGGSLASPTLGGRARHRVFRNRGNGSFEDVTTKMGLTHAQYGMGACAADYDNDGWPDLYVTNVGLNLLYHNDEGKGFTDVTEAAGVPGASFSASCAFADIDRDGDVDLFVTHYVDARPDNNIFCGDASRQFRIYCHPLNFKPLENVLYRNDGDGTFTDISRQAGIAGHPGNGLGVVVGDYDDDGWPDIFVANDTTPNFLFHNQGNGTFKEVALLAGVAVASDGRPRAGMGTDVADYDGDGRLDLFVTNHELESHTLFHNAGKGLFDDVTFASGVGPATLPYVGFGAVFFDYDNDMDLDLAVINGHVMNSPGHFRPGATEAQRKLLFENNGKGTFTEVGRTAGPGFATVRVGRALAAGDADNDGDLDLLVVNNGGPVELLRNTSKPENGALIIRLVGVKSNRSAIGARVRVTVGGTTAMREVKGGSSYLAQNDLRVHVGLGAHKQADLVEVRWPSGTVDRLGAVLADQLITITEGHGATSRLPARKR